MINNDIILSSIVHNYIFLVQHGKTVPITKEIHSKIINYVII